MTFEEQIARLETRVNTALRHIARLEKQLNPDKPKKPKVMQPRKRRLSKVEQMAEAHLYITNRFAKKHIAI